MEKRMKYPMKCSRHINSAADSKCVKKIYHREYKYTIGKWNYLCSFHKNKKVFKICPICGGFGAVGVLHYTKIRERKLTHMYERSIMLTAQHSTAQHSS